MCAEQVGIYLLLLLEEWDKGPLPTRGGDLTEICQGADVAEIRRVLRLCFRKNEHGWVNDPIEEVRRNQQAKHERRVEAGRKGGEANRDKDSPTNA